MPKQISVGNDVFVPATRLETTVQPPYAVVRVRVAATDQRSATVESPYHNGGQIVAKTFLQENVGVLIIKIGDLETETTLLDPLAATLSHFFRLLLPDDQLRSFSIRTADELYDIYSRHSAPYTHIIIVGHAGGSNINFALNHQESSLQLVQRFQALSSVPHEFVTLCCHSGEAAFAKPFSAAQFAEALFAFHFLDGLTWKIAFNRARKNVSGGSPFRIWHQGNFEGRA
jgi:hypothetical protein